MSKQEYERRELSLEMVNGSLIVPFYYKGKKYRALVDTASYCCAVGLNFLDEAMLPINDQGGFVLDEFGFDEDSKYLLTDLNVLFIDSKEDLGFDVVLGVQGLVGTAIFVDGDGTFKFNYLVEK